MDLGLSGKRALVTGASKGIGAATACVLAEEGCSVVLISRTEADLERTAKRIRDAGGKADILAADLSQPGEAQRVAAAFPTVDILVNNAGAIPGGNLAAVDEATWRKAWDLKVFGYINMCRLYYAAMRAQGGGVIVNVVGAAAQIRDPEYICGVTGNAALTAFTLSLGSSSHKDMIRVVGVSPGPVATERLLNIERHSTVVLPRPFGRAATPEEIAQTVAFACGRPSSYLSGAVILVDGGISARAQS
jgi:NAD(P)-dependent dehydrogenase (short-subunit alcohol dehydrogenase family)